MKTRLQLQASNLKSKFNNLILFCALRFQKLMFKIPGQYYESKIYSICLTKCQNKKAVAKTEARSRQPMRAKRILSNQLYFVLFFTHLKITIKKSYMLEALIYTHELIKLNILILTCLTV